MTICAIDNKGEVTDQIDAKKELIRRLLCPTASDDELELFMHVCKKTGLDPFIKQIYPIKRGDQLTIQTGIDGLRLIAERTQNYTPGREAAFGHDDKGNLLSATSFIKKRTQDGQWHEVAATAYLVEYNAKQGLWQKMPRAMLSKCAEALALRRAFPAEMSGLYTKEEMDQAESSPPKEEPKEQNLLAELPLTKEQIGEFNSLIVKIKRREFHEEKLVSLLGITELADVAQKDFQRIITYLNQVILIQEKQEVAS